MDDLPVDKTRIKLAHATNKIRDFISTAIKQAELAGTKTYGRIDHRLTRPGHQVEHHQLVFFTVRHVVSDFTQVKTNQIVGHIFGQHEA